MQQNNKIEQWITRLKNYQTHFDNLVDKKYREFNILKVGEIYEFDFGYGIGFELSGRHYGLVIKSTDKNTLVNIVPLKTYKGKVNLCDVFIGKIDGIVGESIAIVSQIKTMEKMRIFNQASIQDKVILKANEEQIKLVKDKILERFK